MTYDWVHTNRAGDKFMAQRWLDAMLANWHLIDKDAPEAPSNVQHRDLTSSSVTLMWAGKDVNDISPLTFDIYLDGDSIGTTEDTIFNVVELNSETAYDLQILASDLAGNTSSLSAVHSVTTGTPTNYSLTLTADNGSIQANPDAGGGDYQDGTLVELTPMPDGGYAFSHWSGDIFPGEENNIPLDVIMSSDKNITANFVTTTYTLTTNIVDGELTIVPDQANYQFNTEISVTASSPVSVYEFKRWSGDVPDSMRFDNPLVFNIAQNTEITAVMGFKELQLTIVADNGTVITNPDSTDHKFIINTNVQLTAGADPGYEFTGWTGDVPGSKKNDNPLTLKMETEKTLTANFEPTSPAGFKIIDNVSMVYPNPFNENLIVQSVEPIKLIKIIDLSGRTKIQKTGNGNRTEISVQSFENGIYFVQVFDFSGKTAVHKVVKE